MPDFFIIWPGEDFRLETLLHQELREIFDDLLEHFGPQHWWPGETPLEVVVGAILTQNVAWNNVEKAINNLQGKDLLSVAGLVQVPREELAELIIPTRYYNQKATRLKGFMIMVEEEFSGEMDKLLALETDELRRLLLKSKGIGKETADSILLYAADRPVFVVDAYTRRIFSRLGYVEEKVSYDEMQALFTNHLPADTDLFNEYHALIVALGKDICRARNPLCSDCPLNHRCSYRIAEDGKQPEDNGRDNTEYYENAEDTK